MKLNYLKFLTLTLCWLSLGAWTDASFNFRATSGYVTDSTGQTYVLGSADLYPTTRTLTGTADDVTFGWDSALVDGTRDRDNAIGPELAGQNQVKAPNNPRTFQVDLTTPGDYIICIANGDAINTQADQYLEFFDNSTSLFVIATSSLVGGTFKDASDVLRNTAAWATDQVCVTHTFATSTFKMTMGGGGTSGTDEGTIAHIQIILDSVPPPSGGGLINQYPMSGGMQ